jgi:Uma2 family endonuclease
MALQIKQEPITTHKSPEITDQGAKRLFTVDEYYRMAEVGILHPEERVELIEGVIYNMSPANSPHAGCVNTLNKLLTKIAGDLALLSVQNPLFVDEHSEPEPDVALLRPREDNYRESHPTPKDAFLIIEVSDSTIDTDRRDKVPLYAQAGVAVLWIVDVQKSAIDVYTVPSEGQFTKFERIGRGQSIEVRGIPGAILHVDDIFGS